MDSPPFAITVIDDVQIENQSPHIPILTWEAHTEGGPTAATPAVWPHLNRCSWDEIPACAGRLPAISAMALRMAESLDLPVVLNLVAQEVATFFDGVCHVSFTPLQRPGDAQQVVAAPNRIPISTPLLIDTPPRPAKPDPASRMVRHIVPLNARGNRIGMIDVVIQMSDDSTIRCTSCLLQMIAPHAALAIDAADQVTSRHPSDSTGTAAATKGDRGTTLALVAHDLRQPLATLSTSVQQLVRDVRGVQALDRDKLAFFTEMAEAAITQLEQQIGALTPARTVWHERSTLATAQVDLVDLTRLMAHFYQQTTDRHQITVVAGVPKLSGSWSQPALERVLGNLLTNGIKYSPVGGVIHVTVGREEDALGHWATLSVANDGIGIPAQDLPRIAQPRYRAGNVGQIAGTGYGLMSVRTVVEQYGGMLAIQSAPGGTTTVLVRLPVPSVAAPT